MQGLKDTISNIIDQKQLHTTKFYTKNNKQFVILMDEVDGMKTDHFGTQHLIKLIKKTKVPIVCIANDNRH